MMEMGLRAEETLCRSDWRYDKFVYATNENCIWVLNTNWGRWNVNQAPNDVANRP
jgi:hypothetical protein